MKCYNWIIILHSHVLGTGDPMPKSSCLAVSPLFETNHYFGGVEEPRVRLSQILKEFKPVCYSINIRNLDKGQFLRKTSKRKVTKLSTLSLALLGNQPKKEGL